jgi:hypothetical protein
MPLSMVTVNGTFLDATKAPLTGQVTFVPVAVLTASGVPVPVLVTDTSDSIVIGPAGITRVLAAGAFTVALAPTDAAGLSPSGWAYQVTVSLDGVQPQQFMRLIPHTPSPVDFSALVPVTLAQALYSYVPTAGGTMSGPLILAGSPPLQIPAGAAAGDVLTSDGSGNAAWAAAPGDKTFTQPFTSTASVSVAHGLGKYPAVTVMDTSDDVCVGDVVYADLNHLTVSFSAPFSGTVICN